MAKPFRLVVQGDREIIAILNGIERRVARKQMRGALKRAANNVIMPEARNRAPFDEGELEAAVKVVAMKRSRSHFGYDVVFRSDVRHAVEQEFGNKRHRAQPFLRPAGYGNESRIRQMVLDELRFSIKETEVLIGKSGAKFFKDVTGKFQRVGGGFASNVELRAEGLL